MKETLTHPLVASSFTNLVRLLAVYGCDARQAPRAAVLLLMTLLRQPLIWTERMRHGGRVARQRIHPAPVFILGHWRSGTTHLQNLMSCDPQFGRVTLLQAAMPHEYLLLPDTLKSHIGSMLPTQRLMDNVPVSADVPWEEELALTAFGRLSFYHVSFFPRSMERIFTEAVMFEGGGSRLVDSWKRQYVHILRKVQAAQPGLRLLLKNPANTARLSLLRELFPGARYIHLHRNPYKVFASSVHLYLKAQEAWGLQATDRTRVVRHVLDSYPRLMHAFFEQRAGMPDNELADVSFGDLQREPIGTMAAIYQQLGLSSFDQAVPHFESYLESQRDYRKNTLVLDPTEKEAVANRWRDVFERLGYNR